MLVTPISNRIINIQPYNSKSRMSESTGSVAKMPTRANISFGYGGPTCFDYARSGDWDGIRRYLDRGNDINAQDFYGWTMLHYATWWQNEHIVRNLLERDGIDINIVGSEDRRTAEDLAVAKGNASIEQLFIDYRERKKAEQRNPYTFCEAARLGNVELMAKELDEGVDINAKVGDYGYTALRQTIFWRKKDAFDFLLSQGDIDVNAIDTQGNPPIFTAIKYKDIYMIEKLLDRDDIDLTIRNRAGEIALDYAEKYAADVYGNIKTKIRRKTNYQLEHPESIVKKKKSVNRQALKSTQAVDTEKLSPKDNIWTSEEISDKFAKLIAEKKYDDAAKMLEKTPLIDFEAGGRSLISKVGLTGNPDLILKSTDYIFHKQSEMRKEYDRERSEFFENASGMPYSELRESNVIINTKDGFRILMGKEEFNPNDKCGQYSLIENACLIDPSGDLAKEILSKYDDVEVSGIDTRQNDDLKKVIDEYKEIGMYRTKLNKIRQSLSKPETLDEGINLAKDYIMSDIFRPEVVDDAGNNLLHIMSGLTDERAKGLIQKLTDKGIDINSTNIAGQTPLMRAIKQLIVPRTTDEKEKILSNIKFIMDKGSDINAQDSNGQTAFHYACMTTSVALLGLILSKNPNVFLKDIKGNKPSAYLKTEQMKDVFRDYVKDLI